MPTLADKLDSSLANPLRMGQAHAGMLGATGDTVTIEVIGFNVARQHFYTVATMTVDAIQQIIGTLQIDMVQLAKQIAADNRDTGATIKSISVADSSGEGSSAPTLLQFDGNDIWGDVGSGGSVIGGSGTADPQAFLQEFGYMHTTGEMIQNPYMIPALDKVSGPFVAAMMEVAKIGDHFPVALPPTVMQAISQHRTGLYTLSRAMGDVQVFGLGMPGVRSGALSAARGLGDLNALMRGGISSIARIQTRMLGSLATGTGRVNMSSYGSASGRIYNRFSGKGFGMGIRGLGMNR